MDSLTPAAAHSQNGLMRGAYIRCWPRGRLPAATVWQSPLKRRPKIQRFLWVPGRKSPSGTAQPLLSGRPSRTQGEPFKNVNNLIKVNSFIGSHFAMSRPPLLSGGRGGEHTCGRCSLLTVFCPRMFCLGRPARSRGRIASGPLFLEWWVEKGLPLGKAEFHKTSSHSCGARGGGG